MATPGRYTPRSLRIALLVYRGNPHSGGQGVYIRHLARELVGLGHRVTVFAGQPWPRLDTGVEFVPLPSLDFYRQPDPFRIPRLWELRDWIDLVELGLLCTAGFPEPLTFSLRARRALAGRRADFDLVHDNSGLGWGLQSMMAGGWPTMVSLHHPVTVDRRLELQHAVGFRRRLALRRWYGFAKMQNRVASKVPRILVPSKSSAADIATEMGLDADRLSVVHMGVDVEQFRPRPDIERRPGRIMVTASADVPLKGLVPLLEAVAKLRTERQLELVVIGRPRVGGTVGENIERLGLLDVVRWEGGVSEERIVELYAEAAVAVVPSLYEGFSLPAVEAMACGVPLVATTAGALPEVVGDDGVTALLVPPGDPGRLAEAIGRVLDDPELAARLARAGRQRVLSRFTWRRCAELTAEHYRLLLGEPAC